MIINRVAAVKASSRTLKLRGHGHNPPTDNAGGLPRGLVSQLKGFCMEGLKIRNWDKWQSYRKDRGQPSWIKLHREVMRNIEWVSLTDAQRGQLVTIWLLAADHEGTIPNSPQVIKKLCHMDSEPDLQLFVNLGFIDSGNQPVTTCQPSDNQTGAQSRIEKNRYISQNEFDSFWKSYPKKVAKQDAIKAWKKIKQAEIEKILSDIAKRKLNGWSGNTKFIPNASTYLNGRRWEDELDTHHDSDLVPGAI